jgi:hypothetical protein
MYSRMSNEVPTNPRVVAVKMTPVQRQQYRQVFCETCQKDTWHLGTRCTYHTSNILQTGGSSTGEIRTAAVHTGRLDRSFWRNAESHTKQCGVVIEDEEWAKQLFGDEPEQPVATPDQLTCSFCGTPVDHINSLTEKKPVIQFRRDVWKDSNGEVQIQERMTSRAETHHACPNCSLQLRRPIAVRRV